MDEERSRPRLERDETTFLHQRVTPGGPGVAERSNLATSSYRR